MKARDLALTPSNDTWEKVSTLIPEDTDHSDISNKWKNVTITNDTDVAIEIKSTFKSSVSGTGRTIASGDSFNYLELLATELWMKGVSAPTGSVIFSFNQEGGE